MVRTSRELTLQNKTAFVTSTLPCSLILRDQEVLNIGKIVCSNNVLAQVYRHVLSKHNVQIGALPNSHFKYFFLLFYIITSKQVVIFHECCWLAIDLLLLLTHKHVDYYPQVSLASRKRVGIHDLTLLPRFKYLMLSRWFDIYKTPRDNVPGQCYYSYAVKSELRPIVSAVVTSDFSAQTSCINKAVKAVIICSTDVIPSDILRKEYQKVANRLLSDGVPVSIKDHPNSSSRLNLEIDGAKVLDPTLPFECTSPDDYSLFIGLASTTLHFCRPFGHVISIAYLLPNQYAALLEERLTHLTSLGTTPLTPKDLSELDKIVRRSQHAC